MLGGNSESRTKFGTSQYPLILHSMKHNQQLVPHYCKLLGALYTEFCEITQPPSSEFNSEVGNK